ncbi:U3 small nucleolar RNA-interacting protein 2 [Agrilus planipennis]|uniref:U3 small nucleolar RNA-interacting protein 2 n=1 Tax=Agrilus planipennis TaxID=224129 RepID=A0A1W4X574_AGRPL|nr:U3 small nucleolar RNA-interacting protein 2 [Agrilus planipennis]
MSFFTKAKSKKEFTRQNRKRKATEVVQEKNDEITSSEDEANGITEDSSLTSEEELETAQEKKLRLAKVYLQEIEREERRRLENDNEEIGDDLIQKRLKEDYLKQTGKLRLTIADKYTSVDNSNIKILKCKQHRKPITCLCITSDNNFIFSGSKDGIVVKWSLNDFKKIGHFSFSAKNSIPNSPDYPKPITSVAISSDSKFLAVGDESNNIHVWDPQSLKYLNVLRGHRKSVTGLSFKKESHTLYSCSADKSVKVWSLDDMAYVETLYGHHDKITAIDSLYRDRAITAGGSDCSLRIWKIAEESQLIYNGHSGNLDCVKLINEENFLSGADDGQLCVWSSMKKKPLCTIKDAHGIDENNEQPNWICSVTALLNTDLVASGSYDGFIRFWKLDNNFRSIQPLFSVTANGFVNSMEFTSDGKFLVACASTEHKFGRWNVIKSSKISLVIVPLNKIS